MSRKPTPLIHFRPRKLYFRGRKYPRIFLNGFLSHIPPSVFHAILFVVLVRVQVQWMHHQTDQRKYILLLTDGIYLHLISSEVAAGNYWCSHCLLQPSFLHFVQAPRYNYYWLYSYSYSRLYSAVYSYLLLSGSPLSLYYCKSPTLLSETKKKKNRLNFNGNNRWMRESAVSKETALLHRWGGGEWNWTGRLIIINHSAFIRVYILQSSVKKGRSLLTLCGQTNVFWICFIKI